TLLDLADQLFLLAGDHREIVVRELAPLLLDLAAELLPVALHLIAIHVFLPTMEWARQSMPRINGLPIRTAEHVPEPTGRKRKHLRRLSPSRTCKEFRRAQSLQESSVRAPEWPA